MLNLKEEQKKQLRQISCQLTNKITNLITTLDFIQTRAYRRTCEKNYLSYLFISEDNEKISNENIYVADKKDTDATKTCIQVEILI